MDIRFTTIILKSEACLPQGQSRRLGMPYSTFTAHSIENRNWKSAVEGQLMNPQVRSNQQDPAP